MVLHEKTNTPMPKKENERSTIIKYLKDTANKTHDKSLEYDLRRCVMLLNNEDLTDVKELKDALEEACIENEVLAGERNELIMENEHLKTMLNK